MNNDDLNLIIEKSKKNISLSNIFYFIAIFILILGLYFSHQENSILNLVLIVISILVSSFLFLFGFQFYHKNYKTKLKYEFLSNYHDAQLKELRFVVLERNKSSHIAKDLITDLIHRTALFDQEKLKDLPVDLVGIEHNNLVAAAKKRLKDKNLDKESKIVIRSALIRHVLNHSPQNNQQILHLFNMMQKSSL